ncbi:MAG: hypothetical protein KAS39_08240, partial [Actinomycetia bacterium]|nr:hypothetical protein [Actinomycetes bacterium]
DIEEILKEKPELVVIGKGYSGMMKILPEVERKLKEENIELRVETTGKSWGIFNEVSKHSKTIGAFHLTC